MSNFAPFLTIRVEHAYFANDNGSPQITISPTVASLEWLRQHHMFVKPSVDGLIVFCDQDYLEDIVPNGESYRLQFRITSSDPYFRNYTKIDNPDNKSLAIFNCDQANINSSVINISQWINHPDINNLEYIEPISDRDIMNSLVGVVDFLEPRSQFNKLNKLLNLRFENNLALWQYYIPSYLSDKGVSIVDTSNSHNFQIKGHVSLANLEYTIFESNTEIPILKRSELNSIEK
ncbi:hypothetical protein JCM19240_2366 [Vibrio maritimus]|uniref:Uncharacterized protein n=1 Tax=Vibrio maritimus TaxID=990268 RepID=A0A090T0X9_9VIBR|nr:hypothetical protein JCM19240_2366 [Vibrio maritimus]